MFPVTFKNTLTGAWGVAATYLNYCTTIHKFKVEEQINKRRQESLLGGGPKKINDQHKKVALLNKNDQKKSKLL